MKICLQYDNISTLMSKRKLEKYKQKTLLIIGSDSNDSKDLTFGFTLENKDDYYEILP